MRARLSVATKIVYGLGDHTVNLVLSAASLLYLSFLTQVGGLSPSLAGMVILIAHAVEAITGPLMGRISDLTRWKLGRRRGYFLIAAIPSACRSRDVHERAGGFEWARSTTSASTSS
jgi:Na+/melibiose symporter-like transporter